MSVIRVLTIGEIHLGEIVVIVESLASSASPYHAGSWDEEP